VETYTLYDLNEYLKRVIALNFQEPIWISCEIAQIKNVRGINYIDLVQTNDAGEVIAQSSAVIWYKSFLFIKNKLGELLPSLLKEGVELKIKVIVEFNERYGLKLIIEDIDPSYTLGQMELNRSKILEQLQKANVVHMNKALKLPRVIQRVAVISSDNAAGFLDFEKQLYENNYGYYFRLTLFKAALQGSNTASEVVSALEQIKENIDEYDVVAIIRGGGSKIDLAAFDNYQIGLNIATFPIPILTGIGHEIDTSVADLMANKHLKTPTALAAFLIDNNADFESSVIDLCQVSINMAQIHLRNSSVQLQSYIAYLSSAPIEKIKYAHLSLEQSWLNIIQYKNIALRNASQELDLAKNTIDLSDPYNILKKGFTLVKGSHDKYITSVTQVGLNENGVIQFKDGQLEVTFNS
jgi:exodeoxyribonuclease VII large subunit